VSLLSRIGRLAARRVQNDPAFREQLEQRERQKHGAPYWKAAREVAYSSLSDEQALEELRSVIGSDERALAGAIESLADRRSDFLADRQFRLLTAIAENAPVRPIDPALAVLFKQEEELGRLPLAQAFQRLTELEPGLGTLDNAGSELPDARGKAPENAPAGTSSEEIKRLVGIRARSGNALLMSDISASIVKQYVAIRSGRTRADLDTPYFDAPRARSFSSSTAVPRPHVQN
jgi:hypothetical protein